ncbi:hypothetical protein PAEAM_37360 [Paenibacillus sp. GM1FR]|nr:hypothetical protein PAEAM_37360 [Paenibacillus sp. GM1FR]
MDQKDKEGLQMTGSSICLTNHIQMIIERKLEIVNIDSNRQEIKEASFGKINFITH